MVRPLIAGCLVAATLLVSACGREPSVAPAREAAPVAVAERTADQSTLELGRKVYNFRCYFCHGYSGDARTLATTYLAPKPRDFTSTPLQALPRDTMLKAVREGRAGTAMKSFAGIITEEEMAAVTDFIRQEFMVSRAENTRYHTAANGWPDHERNAIAFPFARGELAIDTPWDRLDARQQSGKALFLRSCITCHDHGRVDAPGTVWESRPVSFPRDAYCTSCHRDTPRSAPQGADHPQRPATHTFSVSDGTVPVRVPGSDDVRVAEGYLVHDRAPQLRSPTALERRGESLFQKNCAFCHAADGTSKGWIGSFLEPHPRDLTSRDQMIGMTRDRLARSIAEGLPETSMPAWKHVLTDGDIDALMAYISRAFHPVPGVRRS